MGWVNAEDCVKDPLTRCYLTHLLQIYATKPKRPKGNGNHYELMKKRLKTVAASKGKEDFKDCLFEWGEMETEEDKLTTPSSVPSHYKKYTVEDCKIVVKKPERTDTPRKSYDGPKNAKKVDLAEPRQDPEPVYVATNLNNVEEQLLIELLNEYKDVFAWSYKDLKGVDPSVCQHTIPLREDAKPSKQRLNSYNDNYAKKIEEEIMKLKQAGFIYKIEHTKWVSPLVVVPKKNGTLRVCVNLKKVNAATIRDHYPLLITDHVIKRVTRAEAYSFLDGFSRYNQLSIDPKDQHKTAFATEWGTFALRVMAFGLTNARATFQRLMCHIFREFL